MKRFVISGLSIFLAAAAIVPAVEAKSPSGDSLSKSTLQHRRLEGLDIRDKSSDSLVDTTIQQYRLDVLDTRDKA